jgi:hypothetical protein
MQEKDLVASASRGPHLLEQDSNGIQKQIYGLQVTNDVLLFLLLLYLYFVYDVITYVRMFL